MHHAANLNMCCQPPFQLSIQVPPWLQKLQTIQRPTAFSDLSGVAQLQADAATRLPQLAAVDATELLAVVVVTAADTWPLPVTVAAAEQLADSVTADLTASAVAVGAGSDAAENRFVVEVTAAVSLSVLGAYQHGLLDGMKLDELHRCLCRCQCWCQSCAA